MSSNDNWGRSLFISGEKRGESSAVAFVTLGYLRELVRGLTLSLQEFDKSEEFAQISPIVLGPQVELWVYKRGDEVDQAVMDAEAKILKDHGYSKWERWWHMRPKLPDGLTVRWRGLKGVHDVSQPK